MNTNQKVSVTARMLTDQAMKRLSSIPTSNQRAMELNNAMVQMGQGKFVSDAMAAGMSAPAAVEQGIKNYILGSMKGRKPGLGSLGWGTSVAPDPNSGMQWSTATDAQSGVSAGQTAASIIGSIGAAIGVAADAATSIAAVRDAWTGTDFRDTQVAREAGASEAQIAQLMTAMQAQNQAQVERLQRQIEQQAADRIAAQSAAQPSGMPTWGWILLGVGGLALVGGAFALGGKK